MISDLMQEIEMAGLVGRISMILASIAIVIGVSFVVWMFVGIVRDEIKWRKHKKEVNHE